MTIETQLARMAKVLLVAALALLPSACVTVQQPNQEGVPLRSVPIAQQPVVQQRQTAPLGQPGIQKATLTPSDLLYLGFANSNARVMTSVDPAGVVSVIVYNGTEPRFVLQAKPDGSLNTTHYVNTASSQLQILDSDGDGVPDLKVETFPNKSSVLSKLANPMWVPVPESNAAQPAPSTQRLPMQLSPASQPTKQ